MNWWLFAYFVMFVCGVVGGFIAGMAASSDQAFRVRINDEEYRSREDIGHD